MIFCRLTIASIAQRNWKNSHRKGYLGSVSNHKKKDFLQVGRGFSIYRRKLYGRRFKKPEKLNLKLNNQKKRGKDKVEWLE